MSVETRPRQHASGARKLTWQRRLNQKLGLDKAPGIRKVVYTIVGVTILALGAAMIVLPGPAVVVIPIGLAILASEYAWARRIIRRGRVFVGRRVRRKIARKTQ
jgi:fatty acid desaturase